LLAADGVLGRMPSGQQGVTFQLQFGKRRDDLVRPLVALPMTSRHPRAPGASPGHPFCGASGRLAAKTDSYALCVWTLRRTFGQDAV
jgi:hypothetical protein